MTQKTGCSIEFHAGRPVVVSQGEVIPPLLYCDTMTDIGPIPHAKPALWVERCREFRDSGVHGYTIQPGRTKGEGYGPNRFWTGDGVYPDCSPDDDIFCYDRQASALIAMDPQARFMVRFHEPRPAAWFAANPDHMQRSGTGLGLEQPSLASAKNAEAVAEFARRLVRYCEGQPWADRVIGYLMCPNGEGTVCAPFAGVVFDASPVMQDAFKAWVRARYPDESALRAAWGRPDLTFEAVRVPEDNVWHTLVQRDLEFVEGPEWQPIRDFWMLQRDLHWRRYRTIIRAVREAMGPRPTLLGLDFCKQAMIGWEHNLSFNAQRQRPRYIEIALPSGTAGVAEILDEPGLDYLWTPADYTARGAGYGWEPEGIADSLHLRGKVMWVENDARCLVRGDGDDVNTQGAFRDVKETHAGLLRNACWSLSRGHFDYWMIAGGTYFHHPDVQRHGIEPVRRLVESSTRWPHRETEHAIAMVIDDESLLFSNGAAEFSNLAIVWQRVIGLAHCGIPYRIYLFSDLARAEMPDYRCYLFPNLAWVTDERMDVLAKKVFRDGRLAIFGPLTGVTDGTRLGAEGATRLLGVEMELIKKEVSHRVIVGGAHPIAGRLPASLIYGDHLVYGPIVLPAIGAVEKAGAAELGMATTYWFQNRPGLFLKDHGTHKVAWSAATPLPGNLLRELARESGCHVWCEEDDVVLASDTLAALHSVKPGRRTLRFPTPRPVWNLLDGHKLGDALEAVELDIAPPQTLAFYTGPGKPLA